MLAVRGPACLLGELSAVDGSSWWKCGRAGAGGQPVVPIAAFIDYLRSHGTAGIVLLQMVTARLRDSDRKRVEFAAYDIAARVARRWWSWPTGSANGGAGGAISVALSQDELAGWVGASREAVAKAAVLRSRVWW